ncbi:anti-sigma factor domain-containing protein [Actinomycetes bacterium NPDC127524]
MEKKNCEPLLDYMNGRQSDMDKKRFEKHLAGCEECRNELEEWQILMQDLPFASDPIEPPIGMKERILGNVFTEEPAAEPVKKAPRENSWLKPMLAAALLLSLLGNVYAVVNSGSQENNATEQGNAIDKVEKAVSLKASDHIQSNAKALMIKNDTSLDLVVHADKLDKMKGKEVYQVWLLEKGKPYRAGSFVPNESGEGGVVFKLDSFGSHKWDTIAITLEPDEKSQTPKGSILLSKPL